MGEPDSVDRHVWIAIAGSIDRTNENVVVIAGCSIIPDCLPKIIAAEIIKRVATDDNFRSAILRRRANDNIAPANPGAKDGILPERLLRLTACRDKSAWHDDSRPVPIGRDCIRLLCGARLVSHRLEGLPIVGDMMTLGVEHRSAVFVYN